MAAATASVIAHEPDADACASRSREQRGQRRTDHHAAQAAERHRRGRSPTATAPPGKILRQRLERRAQAHRHAHADQQPPQHHHADAVRRAEHPDPERRRTTACRRSPGAGRSDRAGRPTGICAAAKPRKYSDVSRPRSVARQTQIVRDERRKAEIDAAEHVRDEIAGGEQEEDAQDERRTSCAAQGFRYESGEFNAPAQMKTPSPW